MDKEDQFPKISRIVSRLILSRPLLSFLGALILILISALGLKYTQADFGHEAWFKPNDPLLERFNSFQEKFGNDDNIIVIIHHPKGLINSNSLQLIREMTDEMWKISDVIRVDSLTNFNWIRSGNDDITIGPLFPKGKELSKELLDKRKMTILKHEIIPGYLITNDLKTSFIFAKLRPPFDKALNFDRIVDETRQLTDKYKNTDHEFHLSGGAVVTTTFKESSTQDMQFIIPILSVLLFLLLLFFFRSFVGILIPAFVIISANFSTLGIGAYLGIKINNLTAMVPKILLAIALADVIHILVVFFKKRREGYSIYDSCHYSYLKNFIPTFLTSISTSLGFISLIHTDLVPIANLGALAAIGTMFIWLISYLSTGPLLLWLAPKSPALTKEQKNLYPHLTSTIYHHKKSIILAFCIISGLSIFSAKNLQINSNPYQYFDDEVPLKKANDFIIKNSKGVVGPEIVLTSGKEDGIKDPLFLAKVDRFQSWLNEQTFINRTLSIVDILKQMNRVLNNDDPHFYHIPKTRNAISEQLLLYSFSLPPNLGLNNRVSLDNESLRITALWDIQDSKTTVQTVELIQDKIKEFGLQGEVTGKLLLYQLMNGYVVKTFYSSILIAFLLIFVLLILTFKSLKLGLLSMIPNFLPLIMGAGLMTLFGKSIDFGSVIIASVCLGIAVDDTTHFIANFSLYKKQGLSDEEAVQSIYYTTGPSLIITSFILIISFGVFMFGSFIPNNNFGLFTAFILGLALFSDLILLPAILFSLSKNQK